LKTRGPIYQKDAIKVEMGNLIRMETRLNQNVTLS